MTIDDTARLLAAYREAGMVVLADDNNEALSGVLMAPAETVTAEQINFMARHARGLICLTLTPARCEQLQLPLMVPGADGRDRSNFTISIEAAEGVSTGISAADRAHTVRTAVVQGATPRDLVQPGHVFPLRAAQGGVLKRAGHTEGGCDLARLAGFEAASVITDVVNDDGSLAVDQALADFATKHGLPIGSIADLIDYRLGNETTVERVRGGPVQTQFGQFDLHLFRDQDDDKLHLALSRGTVDPKSPCLVRVQSFSALRDGIGSLMAGEPARWNLRACLERIAAEDHGVVVLLSNCETADDLMQSVELVLDAPQTTERAQNVYSTIGLGSQILRQLGVGKIRLMGPAIRYNAISGFGLKVVEHVPVSGVG